MRKLMIIIVLLCFAWSSALSQSCLPEGITFSTQSQIDSFQINYPGCIEIEGDVMIEGDEISNLIGLNAISSIGGSLQIYWCYSLTNLSGLENLTSIGSRLSFWGNDALSSFAGLNNLNSVGEDIGITWNDSLTDLTALNNLNSIGGRVEIYHNNALTSLSGLENIAASTINNLYISNNCTLSYCEIQSICDYLANPGGPVNIYNNAAGCNNPTEVANGCGITLSCFPFGNYFLQSQLEVDSFFINYPNCFNLQGNLFIGGENITNLIGLNGLNSIEGHLTFHRNNSLINFSGLNTLTAIGGQFQVGYYVDNGNMALTNFIGLEGLITVGESFEIMFNESLLDFSGLNNLRSVGHLTIGSNNALISLSGMENLDSIINTGLMVVANNALPDLSGLDNLNYIESYIDIKYNDSLTSLSGIDNVEANSIDFLHLTNNNLLSMCEVQSVCEYLADSNSHVEIYDNAPGCNSREEVEDACESISVKEQLYNTHLSLFPNPAHQGINISLQGFVIKEVNIYTLTGQRVLQERPVHGSIDISALQAGMYIVEVVVKNSCIRQKLLVQ